MAQVQIDLVDMSNQHVEHEGKVSKYVLSVMDVFIGFHWPYPLQRKSSRHVSTQLLKIFSEHESPERLLSGNVGEFKKRCKKDSVFLYF